MSKERRAKRGGSPKDARGSRGTTTPPETVAAPAKRRKGGKRAVSSKAVSSKAVSSKAASSKPETGATSSPARPTSAVQGQRLYDMPYSSPAPRLVNPELGLDSLIARAGHNAGYDIDLTLLDAPDHRLIRSGVILAHRVLDERGEWYLGAPDWTPLLPSELIESMSQVDLSEELTDAIRPFRRRAPLSPVAALRCERREFALRSRQGPTLALLRDDKVTVRRGGLAIARYREVMLTPVGPGLDQQQRDWLDQCLLGAGATLLPSFPRLARRLGAPATGPTDFPEPAPLDSDAPFFTFVSALVARRLRELLTADLRLRGGDPAAALALVKAAETLRRELDGLRDVLEADWTSDLIDELDWLAAIPVEVGESSAELTGRVSTRLRGERYLSLLDRLVVAVRGVRLGDLGSEPAGSVLARLAADQLTAVAQAGARLAVDGPARAWAETWREFERMAVVDTAVAHLRPDEVDRRHRLMARCRPLLTQVDRFDSTADELMIRVETLPPREAFELGREFERTRETAQTARAAFLVCWAKAWKKLSA